MSITPAYVAGEWWARSGCDATVVHSPYDGSVVGEVAVPDADAVESAVGAAVSATTTWTRQPVHERVEALRAIEAGIEEQTSKLLELLIDEAGKPRSAAQREIRRGARTFGLAADHLSVTRDVAYNLASSPLTGAGTAVVRRVPRGPVLALTPANSPFNLVAHKVAPALAVGAAIVLKPHERTPLIALALADIIDKTANLPAGTLSVLPLPINRVTELVEDRRLRVLSFTGSQIGWRLKAAEPTRHAILELGGTAAVIVDDDVEPAEAARILAAGAFDGSGQSCISTQQGIIHERIYQEVKEQLVEAAQQYQPGDPRQNGSCLRALHRRELIRMQEWLREADFQGAKVVQGGNLEGPFLFPTIVEDVGVSCRLWSQEVFGPIICLRPFNRIEEAFETVNASSFGIHIGLLTNRSDVIWRAFAELEASGVVVGRHSDFRDDALPYGGTKLSGYGREGVEWSMLELTETRTLILP